MATNSLSQHRVSPQRPRRSTAQPAPASPTPKALTLADYDIEWGTVYDGRSLVPVLRFGGSQAISTHLRGLCELLEAHDPLAEDELVFVRESLSELASRLYVSEYNGKYEDEGAAANCKVVVRTPQSAKMAVA